MNSNSEDGANAMEKCFAECPFRIQAEYLLVTQGELPPALKELAAFNHYKRPGGWRLKVWETLIKTNYNGIDAIGTDVFSVGMLSGATVGVENLIESITEEEREAFEEALKRNPVPGFDDLPEDCIEGVESLLEKCDIPRNANAVREKNPKELGDFYEGVSKGLDSMPCVDADGKLHSPKETSATNVYWGLLIFGDYLETLETVEDCYEVILNCEFDGNQNLYQFDTFKRLCNRIGFTGKKYRSSKN